MQEYEWPMLILRAIIDHFSLSGKHLSSASLYKDRDKATDSPGCGDFGFNPTALETLLDVGDEATCNISFEACRYITRSSPSLRTGHPIYRVGIYQCPVLVDFVSFLGHRV